MTYALFGLGFLALIAVFGVGWTCGHRDGYLQAVRDTDRAMTRQGWTR